MRDKVRFASLLCCTFLAATTLPAQKKPPPKNSPNLLLPASEDVLRSWNDVGGKLVDMAKDFPEDKFDFKVQKNQRTSAETFLHVSGMLYQTTSAIKGSKVGPAFDEMKGPAQADYKTKADVVKLLQNAVAAGAAVIQAQGDAGLNMPVPSPCIADAVRASTFWGA